MIYVAIAPIMSISENVQDDAVKVIHDIYSSIGFKPPSKQFTILASFYLTRQINCSKTNFKPISLTTGTKCTPAAKYSPRGELLHDTHAEVLARRGAVRVTESGILSDSDDNPPYCLRPGVSLHMYVSTLPCGDASMGYLAYTQDARMASLKSQSAHLFPKLGSQEASRGRDDYNRLGVLRTKPGRADSQPALSMSCSDKIAKWSVLGILGGFASRFLEPVYIENVVIGEFPHEKEENFRLREIIKRDCERALQARIGKVEDLPEGYDTRPPNIYYTNIPFIHSKRERDKIESTTGSCNECLCWVADSRPAEILINGLKRSTAPKNRYVEKYRNGLVFHLCSQRSHF